MSLFRFLRNELIDIIEWNAPQGSEIMAWRFPRRDNEIKNGAKLVVREGQIAVFVDQGQLADVFGPGMYTLSTSNIPILSKIKGWKYGFESPFKADCYFIQTRRFTDQKWGTANPVMMRDQEFGMVRIRAYGSYALQVTDGAAFLRELLSSSPQFEVVEISGQLRNMIVTQFSNAVAQSNIPVLDLAANLVALSDASRDAITGAFAEMGLSVPIFLVENISLPPNVEAALDKRTSMGMIGNMDQYMKYQAATAMEQAATNEGGGAAGIGVGLGAGMAMAQNFVAAMAQPGAAPPAAPAAAGGVATAPPPLPVAAAWFLGIGGQSVGPVDTNVIAQRIAGGEVTRDTLVWKQGMGSWIKAGEVPEMASLFAASPPPMPPH